MALLFSLSPTPFAYIPQFEVYSGGYGTLVLSIAHSLRLYSANWSLFWGIAHSSSSLSPTSLAYTPKHEDFSGRRLALFSLSPRFWLMLHKFISFSKNVVSKHIPNKSAKKEKTSETFVPTRLFPMFLNFHSSLPVLLPGQRQCRHPEFLRYHRS